jgi:serine/threonine protein kinase
VPGVTLSDFGITERIFACDSYVVEHAVHTSTGHHIRLTVFSQDVSRSPEFRRAFKSDRPMLATLRHRSVLNFLGDGESDGRLFCWTEATECCSLAQAIDRGLKLSTEDLIEVGWQVCSALQQAHNIGLSHGGLTAENILVSEDSLQAIVVDFGLSRWLRSIKSEGDRRPQQQDVRIGAGQSPEPAVSGAAFVATSAWRKEVEYDLQSLATVMLRVMDGARREELSSGGPTGPEPVITQGFRRLLNRTMSPETLPPAFRARDLQGRFGELLIGGEDDQMHLLDQREQLMHSRRSIVDELFDHHEIPDSHRRLTAAATSASPSMKLQFLPILGFLVILLLLLVLAAVFR